MLLTRTNSLTLLERSAGCADKDAVWKLRKRARERHDRIQASGSRGNCTGGLIKTENASEQIPTQAKSGLEWSGCSKFGPRGLEAIRDPERWLRHVNPGSGGEGGHTKVRTVIDQAAIFGAQRPTTCDREIGACAIDERGVRFPRGGRAGCEPSRGAETVRGRTEDHRASSNQHVRAEPVARAGGQLHHKAGGYLVHVGVAGEGAACGGELDGVGSEAVVRFHREPAPQPIAIRDEESTSGVDVAGGGAVERVVTGRVRGERSGPF